MDPSLANRLYEEGGFLLILNLPVGTELGIDFYSWNVGQKFIGIKMIPPGIHYVYYSPVDKDGTVGIRTGFFINIKKKETVFRKWIGETEEVTDSCTEDEKMKFGSNLKELDGNLGPYPFQIWKKWLSLSNRLTSTNQNFTPIPAKSYPEGSSGAEVTKYSIDKSFVLQQMASKYETSLEFLSEFQLAFLLFVVGQDYSSFEHWKSLITIICCSDEWIGKDPDLFYEFMGDLYFQLQEVSADLFVDIISEENFLMYCLKTLFDNISTNQLTNQRLHTRTGKLKRFVTKKFQWDFESDFDDDLPVVVAVE